MDLDDPLTGGETHSKESSDSDWDSDMYEPDHASTAYKGGDLQRILDQTNEVEKFLKDLRRNVQGDTLKQLKALLKGVMNEMGRQLQTQRAHQTQLNTEMKNLINKAFNTQKKHL